MIHLPGEHPVTKRDVLEALKSNRTIILPRDGEIKVTRRVPVRGWRGDEFGISIPCFWHQRWEYSNHQPYIVCFECRHMYVTGDDLLQAHADEVAYLKREDPDHFSHILKATDPDEITFCQYCLHDF